MPQFDDQRSLAFLSKAELADYLKAIGDEESVRSLLRKRAKAQDIGHLLGKLYAYGAHVFGFIPEAQSAEPFRAIQPALDVTADPSLIGSRIKLNLDTFYVEEYPGFGKHTVMLEFCGRNQAGSEKEDLRFATAVDVNDQDRAGLNGLPIFTGLLVPPDGLAFETRTIVVGSSGDAAIMAVFKSQLFKSGLSLTAAANPLLPQLVGLASGVTTALLDHRNNKQVQSFDLGLDFARTATSIRLRLGSYVAMQVPDFHAWSWDDWVFSSNSMSVVAKSRTDRVAPFNTLIFSVSRSESPVAQSTQRRRLGSKAV